MTRYAVCCFCSEPGTRPINAFGCVFWLLVVFRPRSARVAMVTGVDSSARKRGRRHRVKWGRNNFLNVQEPNWNFNPLSQAPANKAHA